jgi:hypothetical protein
MDAAAHKVKGNAKVPILYMIDPGEYKGMCPLILSLKPDRLKSRI